MDFDEISEDGLQDSPRYETIIHTSHLVGPAAEFIARNIHNSNMLRGGEKWTITMALSCGYHIEIEMRVHNLGSCAPEEEQGPSSEAATIFGVRSDGLKLPFPSPSLFRPHLYKSKPEAH